MNKELIYLDTSSLQQDMRIRLPKAILNTLPVEKGTTKFTIYLNPEEKELILRIVETSKEDVQ